MREDKAMHPGGVDSHRTRRRGEAPPATVPRLLETIAIISILLSATVLVGRRLTKSSKIQYYYDPRLPKQSGVPLLTPPAVRSQPLTTPAHHYFTAGSDTAICWVGASKETSESPSKKSKEGMCSSQGGNQAHLPPELGTSAFTLKGKDQQLRRGKDTATGENKKKILKEYDDYDDDDYDNDEDDDVVGEKKGKLGKGKVVVVPNRFIGCPPTFTPPETLSKNGNQDMTLLPLFQRQYHHIPLAQYHHRFQLHALEAHYTYHQFKLTRLKRLVWWKMAKMGERTTQQQIHLWAEQEIRMTLLRFNQVVQRTITRANRHADSMRMETLHFLRLFKQTIPELAKVWIGDDFCLWPGVTCHTDYLPLSELFDVEHPTLLQIASHIHSRKKKEGKLSERDETFDGKYVRRFLRRMFSNRKQKHYFLRWVGGVPNDNTDGFIYPKSMTHAAGLQDRFREELEYSFHFPQSDFHPAEVYIGSDFSNTDFPYFTDNEILEFYQERGFNQGMGDQVEVVEKTESIVIPFTSANLDLRQLNLRGSLPNFFQVASEKPDKLKEVYNAYLQSVELRSDAEPHVGKLIYSPRQLEYHSSFQEGAGTSELLRQFPFRVHRLILCVQHQLSYLERVGTHNFHFDLAAYFSEVAYLGLFWGENLRDSTDHTSAMEERAMLKEVPSFDVSPHEYSPTTITTPFVRIDDHHNYGEINPYLVNIQHIQLESNPLLGGSLPKEWLALFHLCLIETRFTSIITSDPPQPPFTTTPRSGGKAYNEDESYFHLYRRLREYSFTGNVSIGVLEYLPQNFTPVKANFRSSVRERYGLGASSAQHHRLEETLHTNSGNGGRYYGAHLIQTIWRKLEEKNESRMSERNLNVVIGLGSPEPISKWKLALQYWGQLPSFFVNCGWGEMWRILDMLYQIDQIGQETY